jgi:hypothetical protein
MPNVADRPPLFAPEALRAVYTPSLDYLKSCTNAGQTTIFVYLKDSTSPALVPGIWRVVREKVRDIRNRSTPFWPRQTRMSRTTIFGVIKKADWRSFWRLN